MRRTWELCRRIVRRAAPAALAAALVLGLLIAPGTAPRAAAVPASDTPVTVRVGYFSNGDFMHKSADGTYAGYDVEYYYTLAGYAGWAIRFVEYASLNDALAALQNGDIDVMSGLSKTAQRESQYLVSAQKMCTAHIAVQTRADDDRFAAGDTDAMGDMTCGILAGSNVVTLYTNWCAQNGLTPHILEYDSLDLRNAALMSGEVDAIAGGSTIAGAQKIAEFPSLDLYFMFNRNRADLKAQLDRAMSILSLLDPAFAINLFEEYFPSTRNTSPSFSAAEKEFLAAHPVIRVAVLENDAPFSSVKADGTAEGILPEYYAHLGQVIGTEFRCVPCASKDAACAALYAGEVDAVGKVENDAFDANDRHLLLTVPYLRMNMVQITRAGTAQVSTAAVPECNAEAADKLLTAMGSSVTTEHCTNSEESFAKLRSGKVDSVICTQPAATWLLNRNRASDYVVLAFGGGTWDITCALAEGSDGNTLRAILDKTIAVDTGTISQLITSDTLEDSADLSGILDHLPVSFLICFAAVMVLLLGIAVAALIVIIRRRSTERKLAARQAELTAAAEANKARHAFFGSVSHDMRTPLNGIIGFTDLALECGDPEKVRDYLGKIRASGGILNGLVNDTLIMSRIENGKYTLHPSPNDLREVLEEVLEPVRELAKEKEIAFTDNASELRRCQVMVDRLSMQKIFLNLLSNAVKFTPAGGAVTLRCALDPENGPQPDIVISVSDTGRGISPEFLPHVFEPFAQENPTNADASGSGMGLSIVKSIVDAMGGTIYADSAPEKGTTFTVRLHLEELPDAPGPSSKVAAEEGARALRGKRVLVCEDNELNMEIVRSILERAGAEVVCAENGKLGVEAFSASAPGYFSAVLLDLRMPVMDGLTAARAIRALDRSDAAAVPIFAVSADAYPENVAECADAGMNGHIAKPVDAAALLSALAGGLGI